MNICQNHAAENDLVFSTHPDPSQSKTVCMAFHCQDKEKLAKIYLNNDPLPWKSTAKHIGCTLQENGTMDQDLKVKRAIFINDCMNLNNEFSYVKPEDQVRLLRIYNSHFSGSSCWNFQSAPFQQLMNSGNVNLRVIFDINGASHNYLVESLSNTEHCKQMIYNRYAKFLSSLESNRRAELRALLQIVKSSCKSITGGNIRKILLDSDILIVPGSTQGQEFNNYRVYEVPEGQEWRIPLAVSLIELRDSRWKVTYDEKTGQMTEDDVTLMLNNVCVE